MRGAVQHSLVAADDRQKRAWPFFAAVAGRGFDRFQRFAVQITSDLERQADPVRLDELGGRLKVKISGTTTEAAVRNGLLDGPSTMFYESGAKMSEAIYRAGLLNGKTTSFYENGGKKAEAEYKDGVLHGVSANWSVDGRELARSTFVNGVLQSENNKAK